MLWKQLVAWIHSSLHRLWKQGPGSWEEHRCAYVGVGSGRLGHSWNWTQEGMQRIIRASASVSARNSKVFFSLKEGWSRLDVREKYFTMRVVNHLAQVAQRGDPFFIPGNIQGRTGQSSEQPDLIDDGQGAWSRWPLKSLPTQTILWSGGKCVVFILKAATMASLQGD